MARTDIRSEQLRDGSGVKRADLDVTTSGSAVIAKLAAGTGIALTSTGPDAGTGDVTAAVSGLTTAALVDLSGSSYYAAIDDDVADTLIIDTSKPALPQYTKSLTGLFPTATDITEWMVVVAIAGKNNDATNRVINAIITINGTEIGTAANATVTAGKFWRFSGKYISAALGVNDTVGVKLWAAVASQIDYRAVTIYIVPRGLGPGAAKGICTIRNTVTATLTGAVAGATYTAFALGTPVIYDQTAAITTNGNASNLIAMTGETILQSAITLDGTLQISAADNSLTLYSLSINRYLRRLTLAA